MVGKLDVCFIHRVLFREHILVDAAKPGYRMHGK